MPRATPAAVSTRRSALFLILCGVGAAIAVYWPTLGYGFAYDDYYFMRPHGWADIGRAVRGNWYDDGVMVPFYRPVTVLWHAARFELFQFSATAHHAVSLALFALLLALVGGFALQVLGSRAHAGLAMAACAAHPGLPYSLVAWITNQMHLLQAVTVFVAVVWWSARRGRCHRWWPLLPLQCLAFGIKEDGLMLIPAIVLLEITYGWIVDRRFTLPPPAFLVASCALLLLLVEGRHLALGRLGGYGSIGGDAMWANWQRGLFRTAFYFPYDRPGKLTAAAIVLPLTFSGLLVGWWRNDRRALFLCAAGVVILVLFNTPFLFATKREQWYLLSIGHAVAFAGAVAVLWEALGSVALRAALGAAVTVALAASGSVSRQMSADFDQFHPVTLGTDDIVVGWHMVAPEIREYLTRKAEAWRNGRKRLYLDEEVRSVTYGAGDWEREPSGQRFRWSTGTVTLFCRQTPGRGVQLPLRAFPRPPGVGSMRVTLIGQDRQILELEGGEWAQGSVAVRRWFPWQMGRADLVVAPTWVPAEVFRGSTDRRRLGVKLGEPNCE